jgi:hypothetical protein
VTTNMPSWNPHSAGKSRDNPERTPRQGVISEVGVLEMPRLRGSW